MKTPMMLLLATIAGMPALATAQAVTPATQQVRPKTDVSEVPSRVRFSGTLPVAKAPGAKAAAADVTPGNRVEIRLWTVRENQRIGALRPAAADADAGARPLMIFHLRAGELTTILNGQRTERHEGDFWTLRGNDSQTIETGNDTAIIETIVVGQP